MWQMEKKQKRNEWKEEQQKLQNLFLYLSVFRLSEPSSYFHQNS